MPAQSNKVRISPRPDAIARLKQSHTIKLEVQPRTEPEDPAPGSASLAKVKKEAVEDPARAAAPSEAPPLPQPRDASSAVDRHEKDAAAMADLRRRLWKPSAAPHAVSKKRVHREKKAADPTATPEGSNKSKKAAKNTATAAETFVLASAPPAPPALVIPQAPLMAPQAPQEVQAAPRRAPSRKSPVAQAARSRISSVSPTMPHLPCEAA
jgi:hypothetical protein